MICATTGQDAFTGTLSISCMGNGLSRRCIPCAPFAPGQRVVWSVLRGRRCGESGSATQRHAGISRPACRRGSCERTRRSVRRAFSSPSRKPACWLMFPSWLFHWVHPYAGETPRIAISFNATIGAHAVDEAAIDEGRAATVATDIPHQFPANVIGWAATVGGPEQPCGQSVNPVSSRQPSWWV